MLGYTCLFQFWFSSGYMHLQGSKGDTDILDTVGEGEGGMTWKNSIRTYTLPYVEQITRGSSTYDAGNPKPVLCDNLEDGVGMERGGEFKREGTHVYLMPIHADVRQKP